MIDLFLALKRRRLTLLILAAVVGCEAKPAATDAGSAGPKLSSTDPAERAAAAREAAEKYGAKP